MILFFNAILEKNSLASQPTLSRFFNRMDEDTLLQFDDIDKNFRDIIYSIKCPEHMLLDLDSTLFGTYGNQEGEGFNFHVEGFFSKMTRQMLKGIRVKTKDELVERIYKYIIRVLQIYLLISFHTIARHGTTFFCK